MDRGIRTHRMQLEAQDAWIRWWPVRKNVLSHGQAGGRAGCVDDRRRDIMRQYDERWTQQSPMCDRRAAVGLTLEARSSPVVPCSLYPRHPGNEWKCKCGRIGWDQFLTRAEERRNWKGLRGFLPPLCLVGSFLLSCGGVFARSPVVSCRRSEAILESVSTDLHSTIAYDKMSNRRIFIWSSLSSTFTLVFSSPIHILSSCRLRLTNLPGWSVHLARAIVLGRPCAPPPTRLSTTPLCSIECSSHSL
jgi:hypothetical protein